MQGDELYTVANKARKQAYAPYSHFSVGAALLCDDGTVYTGCNIENASYGATICAERTAVYKAISDGKRGFSAIAIAGAPDDVENATKICPPCGICRQTLREFCEDDFKILLADGQHLLKELLPLSFTDEKMHLL